MINKIKRFYKKHKERKLRKYCLDMAVRLKCEASKTSYVGELGETIYLAEELRDYINHGVPEK